MRSSWIDRLSRYAHGNGHVLTTPPMSLSVFAPRKADKARSVPAYAMRTSKSARLCLGIGDGSLRSQ